MCSFFIAATLTIMQILVVDTHATVGRKMGPSIMGVPSYGNGITKNKLVINFQPV